MSKVKLVLIFNILVGLLIFSTTSANGAVLLQRVQLKAVGDIMVHDVQYRSVYDWQTGKYDFMPMFEPVKEKLKADILVGNLETTLSGPEVGYSSYPRFNSPDNIAETLKKLGFNLLFTANNHSLDKGMNGLNRTLQVLDKNDIKHTGTFATKKGRTKATILTKKGIKFGFLNYTYGTNGLELPEDKEYMINYLILDKVKKDIDLLRPKVDMVVVGLHFGNEYWREPSQEQRDIVKKVAEFGADIILGGHPHVLQPYEFITVNDKQTFVVYSLGNFVSGQKGRYKDSGAILNLTIEKSIFDDTPKIVEVDFTPIWVRRFYQHGRLKMEVVPFASDIILKKPLSSLEEKKLAQVNMDTWEIWQPIKQSSETNKLFSIWANRNFAFFSPHTFFSLIKSEIK